MIKKTITLPNGVVLIGDEEEVRKVATGSGYVAEGKLARMPHRHGMYFSESRNEYIPVHEMNTIHLRNAILRYYADWVNGMHKIDDPQILIQRMQQGIEDETWNELALELATRKR